MDKGRNNLRQIKIDMQFEDHVRKVPNPNIAPSHSVETLGQCFQSKK